MRFLSFYFIASFLLLSSGCFKDGEVLVDDLSNIKAQVFKVKNQNGKLVIEGKNLNATRKVQIKSDSIDNQMVIESQSESRIVAALSQALTLTASAVYELVLSNAYGQSVYQLSFEIQDGQVTTVKLADGAVSGDKISDMGALSGQILKYNGTTWSPADLNSLVYAGTWDASTGTEPDSSPVGGDFWIVDTDGDVDLGDGNGVRQWRIGDWIVYNSFTAQWDQVISSQSVVSFNGRAGEVTAQANDYTWQQIDKTLAPIDDLTDVDTNTVAPATGEVLKWDGSNWTPQVDIDSGGDITEVNAGTGLLGGATSGSATLDIDVGTGASQIPQLDASGLLLNSIIPGLDTSKITTGTMNTARLPYASSTTDGIISSTDYQTFSDTDTTLSNGAAGEYLDGDGNWYVLDNAAVGLGNVTNDQQIPLASLSTNTALGTDDTLVPSQNAVKTYVDNSVSTASNDYLLRDGTQAMTGNFDGGANDLININNTQVSNELRLMDDDDSNYVALKSPTTVSTNLTWLLPAADGTAGQILSTDGAGNLSWTSSGDGSVTDVTATAPLSSSGTNTPDISISQASSTTDGYLSSTDWNTFNNKEPAVTAGTTAQYRRGDKTWQTLDTSVVPENGNLYYTTTRARTDTVEDQIVDGVTDRAPSQNAVFDELATKADQTSLSNYVLKAGDTMTGQLNLPADGLDIGSGQLIATGGNVGIGTSAPGEKLHVQGGKIRSSRSASQYIQLYGGDGTDTATYLTSISAENNKKPIIFEALNDESGSPAGENYFTFKLGSQSSPRTVMTMKESGDVGIGTGSPNTRLEVAGNDENSSGLTLDNTGVAANNIKMILKSEGVEMARVMASTPDSQNADLKFYTANAGSSAEKMRVTSSGLLGVGTTAPLAPTHVKGQQRDPGTGGFYSYPTGRGFAQIIEAPGTDDGGLLIGVGDNNNDENAIAIWNTTNLEHLFRVKATDGRTLIKGSVGIGTGSPSAKLQVGTSGDGTAALSNAWNTFSDERLKTDKYKIEDTLEKLEQITGYYYYWKEGSDDSRQIGVMAQDVEQAFPDLVHETEDGVKTVDYPKLTAILINALKELKKENRQANQKLEEKVEDLEKENKQMKMFLCREFESKKQPDFCREFMK